MDYLDFEIQIEGDGLNCTVSVIRSPAGETQETVRFPLDELALKIQLQALQIALLQSGGVRRAIPTAEEQTVQDFGRQLFDFIFPSEVRSLYRTSLRDATTLGMGLRIKLHFLNADQASLPWEFLYDSAQGEYVCLSTHTPLIRYLNMGQPQNPLSVSPPLRILGMIANPKDLQELNVDVERRRVEEALQPLVADGRAEIQWLEGQTWQDLQRAMRGGPWHIFHFIGHGGFDAQRDEGLIMLADKEERAKALTATQLGRLLANHKSLRLTVLNACEGATGGVLDIYSSTASILMRRGLPTVLAMQYQISDRAAIQFISSFYEALADNLPIDAAVSEARVAVSVAINNSFEWGTPVLHMRAPDGAVFSMQPPAADVLVDETIDQHEARRTEEPTSEILNKEMDDQDGAKDGEASSPDELLESEQAASQTSAESRSRRNIVYGAGILIFVVLIVVGISWIIKKEPEDNVQINSKDLAEYILVPAGEFVMGADDNDLQAEGDEKPQRIVYVDGFLIKKTETTNAEYGRCIDAGQCTAPINDRWSDPAYADHPVTYISWEQALAYSQWIGGRLPTEAEWEKACRGTTGSLYPWGSESPAPFRANFGESVGDTTPVGSYAQSASQYGVLNMAGNVWEWTMDQYIPDYHSQSDQQNPTVLQAGEGRVVRGGGVHSDAGLIRCSERYQGNLDRRFDNQGFRSVIPQP